MIINVSIFKRKKIKYYPNPTFIKQKNNYVAEHVCIAQLAVLDRLLDKKTFSVCVCVRIIKGKNDW